LAYLGHTTICKTNQPGNVQGVGEEDRNEELVNDYMGIKKEHPGA
jgi:hypothetical protein